MTMHDICEVCSVLVWHGWWPDMYVLGGNVADFTPHRCLDIDLSALRTILLANLNETWRSLPGQFVMTRQILA